ncbi:MAG: DUF1178 family protein [Pseudomonadota bacterium]
MIKYQLQCDRSHAFEGWFRNSTDYQEQADEGLLECPVCGSEAVSKAIMAPAVARNRAAPIGMSDGKPVIPNPERLQAVRKEIMAAAERARSYVEKNFDYVGEAFPEEARKIHYGETKERGIYGEASRDEVHDLAEEGIEVSPLLPARKKPEGKSGKAEVVKKDPTRKLN